MDTTELASAALNFCAGLEEIDGKVGSVMIVAEVETEDGTYFETYCTDDRRWVQRAMLREAEDVVDYFEVEDE